MDSNNMFLNTLFINKKIIMPSFKNKTPPDDLMPDIRTLLILNGPETEENKAFATKIMAACQLRPEQYKMAAPGMNFRNAKQIREIILFGVSEKELGLNVRFPKNKAITFQYKIWIKTDELKAIMNNQSLKNEFWKNALKPCFGL